MRTHVIKYLLRASLVILVISFGSAHESFAQTPASRVDNTLQTITTSVRGGRIGYATFWDGNKFVQCRRLAAGEMRCEAAGMMMQPSLKSVLTTDALKRLKALGWTRDPNFGNYVRDFPADTPTLKMPITF